MPNSGAKYFTNTKSISTCLDKLATFQLYCCKKFCPRGPINDEAFPKNFDRLFLDVNCENRLCKVNRLIKQNESELGNPRENNSDVKDQILESLE